MKIIQFRVQIEDDEHGDRCLCNILVTILERIKCYSRVKAAIHFKKVLNFNENSQTRARGDVMSKVLSSMDYILDFNEFNNTRL